ncbi:MAG: hypothetical protein IJ867_03175 [Clostridia bacterium]|nr:hypothetical protein [Clostridia bacterium]
MEFQFEVEMPIVKERFEIWNLEDFLRFKRLHDSKEMDFAGVDVYLMEDIDLSSIENWYPIGSSDNPFAGIFHGNSHTIANLQMDNIMWNMGLFAQNNGTIQDLTVTGKIRAFTTYCVGGIAGRNARND